MHIVGSVGIAKSEFSSRRGEDYNSHNSPGHTESPDNESSSSSSFHFLFLFLLLLLLLPLVILILLLPPHLAGFEAAQMFLSSREVPDIWKMDMSQILDSSSSDDEDDEEEKESDDEEEGDEEKKKKHIKEEVSVDMTTGVTDAAGKVRYLRLCVCLCVSVCVCVCLCVSVSQPDEEPDPEERDHFLQQLYKFMEDRGEMSCFTPCFYSSCCDRYERTPLFSCRDYQGSTLASYYRHENHSPFGEIPRFETKMGDLRQSCRSDEKIFSWGGHGGIPENEL